MREHRVAIVATLLALCAAVVLAVFAIDLVTNIRGTACDDEFPFCTSLTQRFMRRVLAALCVLGIGTLLAAGWRIWSGGRRAGAYALIGIVLVFAAMMLIIDPVNHMSAERADEWFDEGARAPSLLVATPAHLVRAPRR